MAFRSFLSLLNSNFTATNVDNATFRYNSTDGKFELLYKCGNTYSLVGWNDNSFSYDYYDGSKWVRKWDAISDLVYTKTIETGLSSPSIVDIISYVDEFLPNGKSVNAEVTYSGNSVLVIGKKLSSSRSRYLAMPRTNNNMYVFQKISDGSFIYNTVSYS